MLLYQYEAISVSQYNNSIFPIILIVNSLGPVSLKVYKLINEIFCKISLLQLQVEWSNQATNLLMSRQHSCHDMSKIMAWYDHYFSNKSNMNFARFQLWVHKLYLRWVQGMQTSTRGCQSPVIDGYVHTAMWGHMTWMTLKCRWLHKVKDLKRSWQVTRWPSH